MKELLGASALEQARRIREGAISCEELARLYLERIDRFDGRLSSFVWRARGALDDARRKDRQRREKGRGELPFFGVPIGVKDLNLARFAPAKMGSRAFAWLWSPIDDATVAPLRRAGFVLVGKTATSELGALPVTEPAWNPGPSQTREAQAARGARPRRYLDGNGRPSNEAMRRGSRVWRREGFQDPLLIGAA